MGSKTQADRRAIHFSHDADVGVLGIGPTLGAAFEQAALAMTAAMTDLETIELKEQAEIFCQAPNRELLLVDWLNAIIFEMATRGMIFGEFKVIINGNSLRGVAFGEPVSVEKHSPAVEPKGATHTELKVWQARPDEWHAQCVVDV